MDRAGTPHSPAPAGRRPPTSGSRSSRARAWRRRPPGTVIPAVAVRPGIVTRAGWHADESIRRAAPTYAPELKMVFVHHTDTATTRAVLGLGPDRARDLRLPRAHERLERHRVQLSRRQVRHGLRGPLRRHDEARDRGADEGVQHRLRGHRRHRDVQLRTPPTGCRCGAGAPDRLAARRGPRRPGLAGRDGVVGEPALPGRAARRHERRLRTPRRLPDVVPRFGALCALAAHPGGGAKRSGCRRSGRRRTRPNLHRIAPDAALPLVLRAKFSKQMAFTLTIRGPDGRVVARRRHTNGHIRWTWGGRAAGAPGRALPMDDLGLGGPRVRGHARRAAAVGAARAAGRVLGVEGDGDRGGLASLEHPDGSTLDIASAGGRPADGARDRLRPADDAAGRACRHPRGGERRHDGGRAGRHRALGLRLDLVGRHRLVHVDPREGVQGRAPGRRPRVRELGRLRRPP